MKIVSKLRYQNKLGLWVDQFCEMQRMFEDDVTAFAKSGCSFVLNDKATVMLVECDRGVLWLSVTLNKPSLGSDHLVARIQCAGLYNHEVMADWVSHSIDVMEGFDFGSHRWRCC